MMNDVCADAIGTWFPMIVSSSDHYVSGDIKIRCEKPLGVDYVTVTVMEAKNLANRGSTLSHSTPLHSLSSSVLLSSFRSYISTHTLLCESSIRETRQEDEGHQTRSQSRME